MHFYEKEPISLYLDGLDLLEDVSSELQDIVIYRHPQLGLVLVINGEIQHIEEYQCPYHELLVHLPMSFIKKPQNALILGGGSLFAAYEVLKYPTIECVTLCDHDKRVLDLMKKYYTHAAQVMSDVRFNFVEQDGIDFIEKCTKKYDLIINDCFNMIEVIHTKKVHIYRKLKSLLSDDGLCSDIIYRHVFDGNNTKDSISEIKKDSNIVLSLVPIPEYPGILHIETIWGNNPNLSQSCTCATNEYQKKVIEGETSPFNFFTPSNLPFYLYLPPYIKRFITE